MTKKKAFAKKHVAHDPRCPLCREPLGSSAREACCAWCLGRCLRCGEPADPSTAGDGDKRGRYCSPCSNVEFSGAILLWTYAFKETPSANECLISPELFLELTGLTSITGIKTRPPRIHTRYGAP